MRRRELLAGPFGLPHAHSPTQLQVVLHGIHPQPHGSVATAASRFSESLLCAQLSNDIALWLHGSHAADELAKEARVAGQRQQQHRDGKESGEMGETQYDSE